MKYRKKSPRNRKTKKTPLTGKKKIKVKMSKREQKRKHIGKFADKLRVNKTLNELKLQRERAVLREELDKENIILNRVKFFNLPKLTSEDLNKLKYLLYAYGLPGITYILQQIAESGLSYEEWYSIYGLGVNFDPFAYDENKILYEQSRFKFAPLKF